MTYNFSSPLNLGGITLSKEVAHISTQTHMHISLHWPKTKYLAMNLAGSFSYISQGRRRWQQLSGSTDSWTCHILSWTQLSAGILNVLEIPTETSNFIVHPALLKTEDPETKPKHITEVLIRAKCDKHYREKRTNIGAMTILCLSYSSTNPSWMFKDSCVVWKL